MRSTFILVLLAFATPVVAQDATVPAPSTSTSTTTAVPTTTLPVDEEEPGDLSTTSPQSTARGFLVASRAGDWKKAAEYIDLRRVPKGSRANAGPLFARQLKTVLDRTIWIDPETLSDSPDGNRDDGLPPRRELVGTIKTVKGPVEVALERVTEPDGTLAWKFAPTLIARIPELFAEFGDGPFASFLPDFLIETSIFEVRLWQWIAFVVLLGLGGLLAWLATGPLIRLLGIVVPADRRHQSARLLSGIRGPLRLIVVIVIVTAAQPWLALSVPAASAFAILRKSISTVALTWLWLRIVDVVAAIADDRLRIHGRAGAVSVIPLGRRTFKIFVAILAGIAIVQNLGYDATGILAGLGVGGLALALAAQKTVENLFGGVMLITDQPVRVGDLCRFGTRTGVVEDIGLRSTRVRTPERTIVSIPNAELASKEIENLTLRDRMQLTTTIALRLETTAAQLRAVLEALRRLLDESPRIDHASTSVRFVAIGATALEIQMNTYVVTRDWNEFLAAREEIYLKTLEALDAAGTTLAGRAAPTPPPA